MNLKPKLILTIEYNNEYFKVGDIVSIKRKIDDRISFLTGKLLNLKKQTYKDTYYANYEKASSTDYSTLTLDASKRA